MIKYTSSPQKIKTKMMFLIILQIGIKYKNTSPFKKKSMMQLPISLPVINILWRFLDKIKHAIPT